MDLTGIDLEPIAEMVEKLENGDGFNEILDNLKEVDVAHCQPNKENRLDIWILQKR